MNIKTITITAAAMFTCLLSQLALAQAHVPDGFLSDDLEGAKTLARQQDKPVYIHFTTDWCGWCRKIESDTYPAAEVKAALKKFVAVSLNCTDTSSAKVQQWQRLMNSVGGQGYPTLAMITSDGELLNMVGGYVQPDRLKAELEKALGKYERIKEFKKYAENADPESLEYNLRAMDFYRQLSQFQKAAKSAKIVLEKSADDKEGHAQSAKAHLVIISSINAAPKPDNESVSQATKHLEQLEKLFGSDFASDPSQKVQIFQALVEVAEIHLKTVNPASDSGVIKRTVESVVKISDRIEKQINPSSSGDKLKLQILTANAGIISAQSGDMDRASELISRSIAQHPNSPVVEQIKKFAKSAKIDLK